jgi:hypothetical protein
MTPHLCLSLAIDPALVLLRAGMASDEARALMLTIGLQESGLIHRRQVGGPARSFWQFERGGLAGVLTHRATHDRIREALATLSYHPDTWTTRACGVAVEHNDVLAAAFARCLLWTLPGPLPSRADPVVGWAQYLHAWRPGTPRVETWDAHWAAAWTAVTGTERDT